MPYRCYEPGSTIAALRPLFAQIKGRLVPLLKKNSAEHGSDRRYDFISHFDQHAQLEFGRMVLIAWDTTSNGDASTCRRTLSRRHSIRRTYASRTRVHEHDLQSWPVQLYP